MSTREIKFRAWDKVQKEWRYFTLKQLVVQGNIHYWSDLENWGQYIGLKDKNGKEIYEGDTVEWATDNVGGKSRMAVTIEPENGIVRTYPYVNNTTEIISNIYENKGVLK